MTNLRIHPEVADDLSQAEEWYREIDPELAENLLEDAERHFGMPLDALSVVKPGDWTRAMIGWAVWKETILPQKWIAEAVNLKSAANATRQTRRFVKQPEREPPVRIQKWK